MNLVGAVRALVDDGGIETLVVFLGANNALGVVTQLEVVDDAIDAYNDTITALGRGAGDGGHDWYLFDVAGVLDRLAHRRYIANPAARPPWWTPYELPPALAILRPAVDSQFLIGDGRGGRAAGGLFSLDGVHPTTVAYGLIAQDLIDIMRRAGVECRDIDFGCLVEHDSLVLEPPQKLVAGLRTIGWADEHLGGSGGCSEARDQRGQKGAQPSFELGLEQPRLGGVDRDDVRRGVGERVEAGGQQQRGGDDLEGVALAQVGHRRHIGGEPAHEVDRGGAEGAHRLGGDVALEHRGLLAQQVAEERALGERAGEACGVGGLARRLAPAPPLARQQGEEDLLARLEVAQQVGLRQIDLARDLTQRDLAHGALAREAAGGGKDRLAALCLLLGTPCALVAHAVAV
jgi:hypothetical protein